MNKTGMDCSLNDTTVLRNLILENPNLPLLIFCGEDAWDGEWRYCQAYATRGEVAELTLYGEQWLDKDDYREALADDLCGEKESENMTDEEFDMVIEKRVAETEFVKAIIIWIG